MSVSEPESGVEGLDDRQTVGDGSMDGGVLAGIPPLELQMLCRLAEADLQRQTCSSSSSSSSSTERAQVVQETLPCPSPWAASGCTYPSGHCGAWQLGSVGRTKSDKRASCVKNNQVPPGIPLIHSFGAGCCQDGTWTASLRCGTLRYRTELPVRSVVVRL